MPDSYSEELRRAYAQTTGSSRRPVICPGSSCKLCALIRSIMNFKGKYDDETIELASRMRAKEQYFSNIFFDPDYSQVVLFAYGSQIMKDLAKYQLHATSDYKGFAHPTQGRLMVIDKTIGSNNRPQYGVTPKAAHHQIPAATIPTHNLKDIKGLLERGIDYLPQWRLDTKSHVVRFIGYGQDQTRFFKTVILHWGIRPAEFELVQQGVYNPFISQLNEPEPEIEEDIPDSILEKGLDLVKDEEGYPTLVETEPDTPGSMQERMDQEVAGIQQARTDPAISPEPPTLEEATSKETKPPCWSREYDPEDKECTDKECDWVDTCQSEFLKRYGD